MAIKELIGDIYTLMESREVHQDTTLEEQAALFGKECEQIMLSVLSPTEPRTGALRLSGIGKPLRQQYNQYHGVAAEEIKGSTYIKFLYGHLIEAMLVSLARLSGHSVTEQQKTVKVAGVTGHIDGKIDGLLVDIKSASSKGFKKFSNNTLHKDDPFGYIGQLKAYAHAEDAKEFGWLAMDKTTGQLSLLLYDSEDKSADYAEALDYDIVEHIESVKRAMVSETPPPKCYRDVPVGKSGNRGLDIGCSFCAYKHDCWPDLRVFEYANYTQYLTVVDREPRAVEIPPGF